MCHKTPSDALHTLLPLRSHSAVTFDTRLRFRRDHRTLCARIMWFVSPAGCMLLIISERAHWNAIVAQEIAAPCTGAADGHRSDEPRGGLRAGLRST